MAGICRVIFQIIHSREISGKTVALVYPALQENLEWMAEREKKELKESVEILALTAKQESLGCRVYR